MKEQIEFIKAKCIEANPSIKDLGIGCYIKFKAKSVVFDGIINEKNYAGNYLCGVIGGSKTLKEQEICEILGRDIRLADVLLVLGKHKQYDSSANFLYLESNALWELRKDRLEDQSQETIEFIYNLLK